MSRRKKGSVRPGHGAHCNVCGKDCGKGGPLRSHVESKHGIPYSDYRKYHMSDFIVADQWLSAGNQIIHIRTFESPIQI